MSYDLRPVKSRAELAPLAQQFVENFAKNFGHEPDAELIAKWCKMKVLKLQEAYVSNYIEGYAVQDIRPFSDTVEHIMNPPKANPATKKPVI